MQRHDGWGTRETAKGYFAVNPVSVQSESRLSANSMNYPISLVRSIRRVHSPSRSVRSSCMHFHQCHSKTANVNRDFSLPDCVPGAQGLMVTVKVVGACSYEARSESCGRRLVQTNPAKSQASLPHHFDIGSSRKSTRAWFRLISLSKISNFSRVGTKSFHESRLSNRNTQSTRQL